MATTTNWQDFWHEEHASAFTISRLTRLDILQSLHDGLVQSVQGDLSRRDWLKNAKTLLQQTGWWGKNAVTDTATGEQVNTTFNPSRLQLIYDINTGQAAAAGQWQRLQAAKGTHPYARYITKRDERVREAHRRWDNLVLPVDHPFWQAHWPPNGWRCRCRAIGVSQREYDRGTTPTGAPMKKEAPEEVLRRYTNPRTGEITDLPVGIDPGFAYNAGVVRQRALAGLVKDKLAAASPDLAKAAAVARLSMGLPDENFTGQRPGLATLPPIAAVRLSGTELGENLSHTQLVEKATEWVAQIQRLQDADLLINEDTGWRLSVNRKGVKKMGDNKDQSRPSLQAVAALRELARRAVVVERHADTRHGNKNVQAIYRLVVPLEIGGKLYRVKLTVKELVAPDKQAHLLHALETVQIESAPLGTLPTDTALPAWTTQPTTERTISISQLLKNATGEDGKPFGF